MIHGILVFLTLKLKNKPTFFLLLPFTTCMRFFIFMLEIIISIMKAAKHYTTTLQHTHNMRSAHT